MIAEWYFLVSVMTGTFDPVVGWQYVHRYEHRTSTERECLAIRAQTHADLKATLSSGSGLVITGCQVKR